jgi:hypothetical protein
MYFKALKTSSTPGKPVIADSQKVKGVLCSKADDVQRDRSQHAESTHLVVAVVASTVTVENAQPVCADRARP